MPAIEIVAVNDASNDRAGLSSASYATVQAGPATGLAYSGTFGQYFAAGSYHSYANYYKFDLSTIPAGATIDSVVFSAYCVNDASDTDFVQEVYEFAWPDPLDLTAATWNTPAELTTLFNNGKRLAYLSTASIAYLTRSDYTDDNWVPLLQAAVNAGDPYHYTTLVSSRFRSSNTPSGNEYVSIQVSVKIVVNYTEASGCPLFFGTVF